MAVQSIGAAVSRQQELATAAAAQASQPQFIHGPIQVTPIPKLNPAPNLDGGLSATDFIDQARAWANEGYDNDDLHRLSDAANQLSPEELAYAVKQLGESGELRTWMDSLDRWDIPFVQDPGLNADERRDLFNTFGRMEDSQALSAVWDAMPSHEGFVRSTLPQEFLTGVAGQDGSDASRIGLVDHITRDGIHSDNTEQLSQLVGSIEQPPSLSWTMNALSADDDLIAVDLSVIQRQIANTPADQLDAQIAGLSDEQLGEFLSWSHAIWNTPAGVSENIAAGQGMTEMFDRLGDHLSGEQLFRVWRHIPEDTISSSDFRDVAANAWADDTTGDKAKAFVDASVAFDASEVAAGRNGDVGGKLTDYLERQIRSGHMDTVGAMANAVSTDIQATGPDGEHDNAYAAGVFFGSAIRAIRAAGPDLHGKEMYGLGKDLLSLAVSLSDKAPPGVDWLLDQGMGVMVDWMEGNIDNAVEADVDALFASLSRASGGQVDIKPTNQSGAPEDFKEGMWAVGVGRP